jgi:hypothetical protein
VAALNRGELPTSDQLRQAEARLLALRQVRTRFEEDRNAELFGRRTRANQTGVAGRGPAYYFADAQINSLNEQEQTVAALIETLRASETTERAKLETQVSSLRHEVNELVASRAAKAAAFRQTLVEGALDFQEQKNDPLARMAAYAELKQDPEQGTSIILFSWLVRLFVSFLEVVPVAAKMLFCPPSVYGSLIKAEVLRERRRAERIIDSASEPETAPTPWNEQRRGVADAIGSKKFILRERELGETPAAAG